MEPPVELPVAPAASSSNPVPPGAWNRRFDDVPVALTAEWAGVELSAREISQLKVGDVLTLDPACAAQVAVRLADLRKFTGRLGTQGDRRAIEIAGPFQD